MFQQAHGHPEGSCIEDNAVLHILRKGFDELRGTADGDPERVDAGFRPLQEATFEDPNECDLPSKLEVVLLLPGPPIAFQAVVRQVERFDLTDNVFIKAFVGRFQIVFNGVKLAAGPINLLATNGGLWIGAPDELACPPDHDFFE
jgi:hypothetical protein